MPEQGWIHKEHQRRIHLVVQHIENNLSSALPIAELAEISAFSMHHFHRIFKKTMNENVHRFINRLRVEKAGKMLIFQPDRSLSEIALDCGLQSSVHFARTFRAFTGLSASEYRSRFNFGALYASYVNQEKRTSPEIGHLKLLGEKYERLKIAINKFPERTAACIRYRGPITTEAFAPTIHAEFMRVKAWAKARALLDRNSLYIGVNPDDPYITPAERQRYLACVTTDQPFEPSLEVDKYAIAGGDYAVISLSDQPDIVNELIYLAHIHWLPLSPYQWDDTRPSMHIFLDNDGYRRQFCIPVKLKP